MIWTAHRWPVLLLAVLVWIGRDEAWCEEIITLKVPKVVLPVPGSTSPQGLATQGIIRRFEKLHPNVRLTTVEGIKIEGKGSEISTLMQIAADIPPDILYVNFRNSDSYIQQGFLRPLDDLCSQLSPGELDSRVPTAAWQVIKRPGRDGVTHIWAYPYSSAVMVMTYRRDLLRDAGLDPDHGPQDWKELEEVCRVIHEHDLATNPDARNRKYGLGFDRSVYESWKFMSLLWSAGGEAMSEVAPQEWRATYDTPQAADAFLFYYRLCKKGIAYRGTDVSDLRRKGQIAIDFAYLHDKQLADQDPIQVGVCPVPRGQNGLRGNEVNCGMLGIYAGVKDPRKLQAAWDFIRFYDSDEARAIQTRVYVESGQAQRVNPKFLQQFGYEEYLADVPKEWTDAYEEALASGKPEPYGKNSNLIYKEMSTVFDTMLYDVRMEKLWNAKDEPGLKHRIREILKDSVVRTNERLIGYVPPEQQQRRRIVAGIVAGAVLVTFFFLFRYIWRVFTPTKLETKAGGATLRRHWVAYLILLPALATILIWQYIPLARGSVMAFQDYLIMGGSKWVGLDNFAQVLFDGSFWHALWVTCQFTFWTLALGFFAPIFLAILLQEVPRGKVFFRTVYFIPHILSGLIVIMLWRSFYASDGLINTLLNLAGINAKNNWLSEPSTALVACILPGIWAGMGPGCLIYLAALKGIPEDLYEAADLDGAGFRQKVTQVVFPSLKALLIINFVGAFAGAFHSSANILVMTGGGPYTPYGATEVTSLLIYFNAFLYLRFGFATAMAWTLGAMLVGFTVMQLKRLSQMEFKRTEVA